MRQVYNHLYIDGHSIYRTLIAQPGYPTKVAWYDLLGRPLKQAQAGFSGTSGGTPQYAFSATRTWLDENGRTGKQSTPYYVGIDSPSYTEFNYDALGRVTAKSVPAACGGEMDTTYSYVGRQTKIAASGLCPSGASNATIQMSRSVNVLGQLMQTIDANGKTTSYWTDALGHVAAIQDVEGNVTQATYNALGQRLQSVDPDQGTWNFSYNALGELTSQTDARGVVTTVTARDALGRMTQRQQVSPTTVTGLAVENLLDAWTYDPLNGVGQLGSVARRRGGGTPSSNPVTWSESYAYDPAVRPITTATTINESGTTLNLSSATTYDSVGRVDTQTYPQLPTSSMAGLSVKHTYTGYGQLDALSNAGSGYVYWTLQAQNAWGHVTNEQYPGVITGSHSDYAATGQAQTLSWSGSVGDQVVYTYDSFGNLNTQQRSAGGSTNTESYLYDSLQRLTNATRAIGLAVSYSYSANGNITSKSDNGVDAYSYPRANQRSNGCGPHAAISANGLSYTCDANGNVIGGAISATYDADNHPRSINRGGGAMSWTYSATGAMTSEVSSRGLRYFGPNGYEQIGTGSGATQVHELGPVIVTRTGGVDSVSVVLRDRLGSTISVIDANAPTTRWYDAFGKVRNGDMSDPLGGGLNLNQTIHGFTRHDHADDVQLIHMGGRVYDYQLGRFLQVDPVIGGTGSQALNPYSYVGNNPLSGTDPTGYQACPVGSSCPSMQDQIDGFKSVSSVVNLSTGQTIATSSGSSVQGSQTQGSANTSASSINAASSSGTQTNEATPPANAPQSTVDGSPASNPDSTPHKPRTATVCVGTDCTTTPLTDEVLLTGHSIKGLGAEHTAIEFTGYGKPTNWISAGPQTTGITAFTRYARLISGQGPDQRPTDKPEFNYVMGVITPPAGMTPSQYFSSLQAAQDNYCNCLPYNWYPSPSWFYDPILGPYTGNPDGYNSNGFTAGIIHATGGTPPASLRDDIGAYKPVPDSYFQKRQPKDNNHEN